MTRGKHTCKILKEIRRQIAEANSIEFTTSECRFKGDCSGTCPKCEAEVRYIEQQLRARSLAGKAVALAGISAGMILMSGCGGTPSKQSSETLPSEPDTLIEQIEVADTIEEGELPAIEDTVVVKREEIYEDIIIAGRVSDETQITDPGLIYPGGMNALKQFIASNLRYPQEWGNAGIAGSVVLRLNIDKKGKLVNTEIYSCTVPEDFADYAISEAQRIVALLPDFIPYRKNRKAVKAFFVLPIEFNVPDFERADSTITTTADITDSIAESASLEEL